MSYQYIFGPVPSRRLGISLGIDLVPHKTCSYNCVYCECGPTTDLTISRKEYVPTYEVIQEIDRYLATRPRLDYITFSGSGEPTLHAGLGRIITHIKAHHPEYRLALLTNGSLMSDPMLRGELLPLDLIIPSLDAGTPEVFRRIDHPHGSVTVRDVIDGLAALRAEFSGEIWLEIFVVPGINDNLFEIAALNRAIAKIRPDRVQLNTLDRPGTAPWVKPKSRDGLIAMAAGFEHPRVEVIAAPAERTASPCFSGDILETIIATLHRRPCTAQDLAQIFSIHENEVNKYIQVLVERGEIKALREPRGIFFTPV